MKISLLPNNLRFSLSLYLSLHIQLQIPVILATTACRTGPIHPDALLLFGVLMTLMLMRMALYGQPEDIPRDHEDNFGL